MATPNKKQLFAWFSPTAAELYGSSIYNSDKGEVEVTAVTQSSVDSGISQWPDEIKVGPVTGWARPGRKGSEHSRYL